MRWLMWLVVLTFCVGLIGCAKQTPTASPGINRTLSVPITIKSNKEQVFVVIYTDANVDKKNITEDIKALQELQQDNQPVITPATDLNLAGQGATASVARDNAEQVLEGIESSLRQWQDNRKSEDDNPITETPAPLPAPIPAPAPGEDGPDKSPGEDDNTNKPPGDDGGDNAIPPPENDGDMHGYKYVDTLSYAGPIQIAPAGQQGNSRYYFFLYKLPKGHHGCQTYGDTFTIKYPDGTLKKISPKGSKCGSDYGKPGYWYRPGNSSGHKEVFSMEIYWGKNGQWKSTPDAERKKTTVEIYSNKERVKR